MTPNRWEQVKSLLDEALSTPPAQRSERIAELCGDDAELHEQLSAMAAAHEDAPELLEGSAAEAFAELFDESASQPGGWDGLSASEKMDGRRVGAWRLIERLAEGGMGAVYRARRDDGQFEQIAAVKIVRPDVLTPEMIRQFERERQLLANLRHPHIATLLDGGVEDGVPYLVMELIEGEPIDGYCGRRNLAVRDRLRLFVHVCDAVSYAHRNLTIHRDLKPANILVTDDGRPKVVDFGIARPLRDARAAATVTESESRRLTPEYASPEQIRGEPLTTASDIYSLGVVLYRMLTGRDPYRLSSRMLYEIERAVCEQEPDPPSTAVTRRHDSAEASAPPPAPSSDSLAHRRRELLGDLDAILLKTLRKDPRERYASVDQLADDIRRHLDGLPVSAQPLTWRYRFGKFARRNRLALAAACAVALSLAAGVAGILWQSSEAARQRDLALAAQTHAEQQAERATIAAQTAEQVNQFLQDVLSAVEPDRSGHDVTVREVLDQASERLKSDFTDAPAVAAAIHHTLGESYSSLGLYETSEQHLRRAIELWAGLGDDARDERATCMNDLAVVLYNRAAYAEAETVLQNVLELQRTLFGDDDAELARVTNNLAAVIKAQGRFDEAEPLYREALERQRRAFGEQHVQIAETFNNLAGLHLARGEFEPAERYCRQSLEMRRELFGDQNVDVAQSMDNLAVLLQRQNRSDEAIPLHEQASAVLRELLGPDHPFLATSLTNLANARIALGSVERAVEPLSEAERIRTATLNADDWRLAHTRMLLGECLQRTGDADRAGALLTQAHGVFERSFGDDHRLTKRAAAALAALQSPASSPTTAPADRPPDPPP